MRPHKVPDHWLTRARRKSRMTQKALALALNIHPVSVNRWERGTRNPSLATIREIARILGMTVAELLDS